MLDSLEPAAQQAILTLAPSTLSVLSVLALMLVLKRFVFKPGAPALDGPEDDSDNTPPTGERRSPLMPACALLALTLAAITTDMAIRVGWDVQALLWPNDATLRTVHAIIAGALVATIGGLLARVAPTPLAFALRLILGAGWGVLLVWLLGGFLLANGVWSPERFWWTAGATGAVLGTVWALIASAGSTTHSPAMNALSSAVLLGAASGPIFLSKGTAPANAMGGIALAFALLALASLRWRELGRSGAVPGMALVVLATMAAVPALADGTMLDATAYSLALAPLMLGILALPFVRRWPGPAWLLPGTVQLGAILACLGLSTAFASGLLTIDPEQAPWKLESPDEDDPYAGYEWG